MRELTEYEVACIRAKKRIEYRYAIEAGMEPVEKRPWESEADFRNRIRETLMDASFSLRTKMQEDKQREYGMLQVEYDDGGLLSE